MLAETYLTKPGKHPFADIKQSLTLFNLSDVIGHSRHSMHTHLQTLGKVLQSEHPAIQLIDIVAPVGLKTLQPLGFSFPVLLSHTYLHLKLLQVIAYTVNFLYEQLVIFKISILTDIRALVQVTLTPLR